jgi:hypothetical protein
MIKTNTILELEALGRFNEAGYGRLFAYNSLHFNATVDARTKAKFLRKLNPETANDLQHETLYSGPTVFFNSNIDIKNYKVDKIDLKTAYASYLINAEIKKPGIFRIKHDGVFPLSDMIALYIIQFNCDVNNMFVKWFLNSSAIQKKKIKTDGTRVWGSIGIFSSTWMNLIKYVNKYLSPEEATILKTYTFHGKQVVDVKKSQIRKLYEDKEDGYGSAKKMLVQSTGWLALIDKPTYYHMVQYIKYHLLWTTYNFHLDEDLIGIQTDCAFYRVSERTEKQYQYICDKSVTLSHEKSTMGTFSFKRVESDEIIHNRARVVLKSA